MNLDEFRASIAAAKAKGHEHMMLTVERKRAPRYRDSARLWRGGPRCRFVGEVGRGRWLVDVKIADLEPALNRLDAGPEPATDRGWPLTT